MFAAKGKFVFFCDFRKKEKFLPREKSRREKSTESFDLRNWSSLKVPAKNFTKIADSFPHLSDARKAIPENDIFVTEKSAHVWA